MVKAAAFRSADVGPHWVYNLGPNPTQPIYCRSCHFICNGANVCEYIDPELFAGCERYKPDMEAMQELWNHKLDANEKEAASVWGIISQFYGQIVRSKCKVECEGVVTLIPHSNVTLIRASANTTSLLGNVDAPSPLALPMQQRFFTSLQNDEELNELGVKQVWGLMVTTSDHYAHLCRLKNLIPLGLRDGGSLCDWRWSPQSHFISESHC
ncbi:hypothetical protein DFH08DRAFT_828481 [Mycena albidolilacea]|uniref:Uncharacterized protein n=1 Tax=Mycena albidolilacea TaxID=1033008 RepID=A0AAD7E654_9AGAR|nr:hypothetical protein DFH08DRAFT_828481 [Mycena albidolilacea]